jgi:quinohemoprotein ethanol dehydrogenase
MGIDSSGRPIENDAVRQLKDPKIVMPSPEGAHNWHPMSFNPTTGLVYLGVLNDTAVHAVTSDFKINLHDQITGADRSYIGPVRDQWLKMVSTGRLVAWDPVAQKEVWHADLPDPKSGGTLTTAGNLVFQGRADGTLVAYRATDGKQLWEFDTGIGIAAPPMTYEVNGNQYIAVLAGWGGPMVLNNRPVGKGKVGPGLLLSFALGGSAPLTPFKRKIFPVPMPTFQVAATAPVIEKGRVLFAMYCGRCHGGNVVSGGSVPDLRYAEEPTHQMFEEIVRGGARREFGMPSFAEDLTSEQVRFIHAYILDRARDSAKADAARR